MSIALVTGASRGIGRACALALAKRGYDVAVNYVSNEAAAQAVVAEIEALGVRSLAVRANTAELPEVKDMFRTVVREMGGLDVLVNNAGVVDDRYLMMLTEDSLTRSLDINIKGYFHCAQQAALKMFKKKSGVIVNIQAGAQIGPGRACRAVGREHRALAQNFNGYLLHHNALRVDSRRPTGRSGRMPASPECR